MRCTRAAEFKLPRGVSAARLAPGSEQEVSVVLRAFDLCTPHVAGIFRAFKNNCLRYKEPDGTFNIIKCAKAHAYEQELHIHELLHSSAAATHDFFIENDCYFISRQKLTPYTMMDLAFAFRHFDPDDMGVFKDILLLTGACTPEYFTDNWFDPIKNEELWNVYAKLGGVIYNALCSANQYADDIVSHGVLGVVTLDNQDLSGKFFDYGDFHKSPTQQGVAHLVSYYSYLLPLIGSCDALAPERLTTFNPSEGYDYSEIKMCWFKKYFKYWHLTYHPNCVDCPDDDCLVNCMNFNILFSTLIPDQAFGPLVSRSYVDGVPTVVTVGYHSRSLGILMNNDLCLSANSSDLLATLKFIGDPTLPVMASKSLVDFRTPLKSLSSAHNRSGRNYNAYFNYDFYSFAQRYGLFSDDSSVKVSHYFFLPQSDTALEDFSFYRYNRPVVLDICQARFVYSMLKRYLTCYDTGCISAEDVVVNSPGKSPGYPYSSFARAGHFYDALSHVEQNQLLAYCKRNVLPTITQLNLKFALSKKNRVRTVGGSSILATMLGRMVHQQLLKSIAATPGQPIVIGRTKFFGGWNAMLTELTDISNPLLVGWDYPKCDRCMPSVIRHLAGLALLSGHVGCCSQLDKVYITANTDAQYVNEVIYCTGSYYVKPGGTTSGDSTTAYANSLFNMFQLFTANLNTVLTGNFTNCNDPDIKTLQAELYHALYRSTNPPEETVEKFINHFQSCCRMMILSDDGVVCIDKNAFKKGFVAGLPQFRQTLYYQNCVFMEDEKCWVEEDVTKGPHEFCSQHTMLVDGEYLPWPDPSRILAACCFISDADKLDPIVSLERATALAIDAWPLTKHEDPYYRLVFEVLLDWIKQLRSTLSTESLEEFALDVFGESDAPFYSVDFYESMYKKAMLQSSQKCLLCNTPTLLKCLSCRFRTPLCTKCAYDHAVDTDHHRFSSLSPYVCNHHDCSEDDVMKLYISGNGIYCSIHAGAISLKLALGGEIFGLYKGLSHGSSLINDFNRASTLTWDQVEHYTWSNQLSPPLDRFAATQLRLLEEEVRESYSPGVVTGFNGESLDIEWDDVAHKPVVGPKVLFAGYIPCGGGLKFMGEFILTPMLDGSYSFTQMSTSKPCLGMKLKVTTHNVLQLTGPIVANQSRIPLMYTPANSDSPHLERYLEALTRTYTTVQGPPGTGKSSFAVGFASTFCDLKFLFVSAAHAAVDALALTASKMLPLDDCTRVVPRRCVVEVFKGIPINDLTKRCIFCTFLSLPKITVDVVIVDECSMVTNYDLGIVNTRVKYKHIVYIGDPQQLPAPRMLLSQTLEPKDYNVVTRLMCHAGPDVFLDTCYRCPLEVVTTVSRTIYEGRLKGSREASGECFKIFCQGQPKTVAKSMVNQEQLDIVVSFLKSCNWPNAVFISPYLAQNALAVKCGLLAHTVESAQGSEFDYVVYTQTSSSNHATNLNRLNVAITRARRGVLCVMSSRSHFDSLDFKTLNETDLQSRSNLFKICKADVRLSPSQATTVLDDTCPLPSGDVVPYSYVVSMLGFDFSNQPEGVEHTLFCDEEFALLNAPGLLGFDVEAVHSDYNNVGTSYPFELGFSTGMSFIVKPEGCLVTECGCEFKQLKYRFPKGEQFQRLRQLAKVARDWGTVRPALVRHMCEYYSDKSVEPIFLVFSAPLELMTLRYFLKIGPIRYCHCGNKANIIANGTFLCFKHGYGGEFLYNFYVFDLHKVYPVGSLTHNHDFFCTTHSNAHTASADAIMTVCLAMHHFFSGKVRWQVTYPVSPINDSLNRAGRLVMSVVVKACLMALKPEAIHDVGNPKGIKCVDTATPWYFYDSNPIADNVTRLHYDGTQEFKGLTLFWNCNVDCYPSNAIVCRYDTRVKDRSTLDAWDGGVVYFNKHAFYTPKFYPSSLRHLNKWPCVYYDDTPCGPGGLNYKPVASMRCVVPCNIGGAICEFHHKRYVTYIQAFNIFSAKFIVAVPRDFHYTKLARYDFNLQLPVSLLKSLGVSAIYHAPLADLPACRDLTTNQLVAFTADYTQQFRECTNGCLFTTEKADGAFSILYAGVCWYVLLRLSGCDIPCKECRSLEDFKPQSEFERECYEGKRESDPFCQLDKSGPKYYAALARGVQLGMPLVSLNGYYTCQDKVYLPIPSSALQSTWVGVHVMPDLYRRLSLVSDSDFNIPDYGAPPSLPEGVCVNYVKFTQVLRHHFSTRRPVSTKFDILHLGAASGDGTSPSTLVLRQLFPLSQITALDLRPFCADADITVVKPVSEYTVDVKYDFILSDVYDPVLKAGFTSNTVNEVLLCIERHLAYGGSALVKFTDRSWDSKGIQNFLSKFQSFQVFVSAVNISSSEFFISCNCFNPLTPVEVSGDLRKGVILWRNSLVASSSWYSILECYSPRVVTVSAVPLSEVDGDSRVAGCVNAGLLLIK